MNEIAAAIKAVLNAKGTNAKQHVLSANQNVDGFQEVLKFIYNPYNKTGISSAKLAKTVSLGGNAQEAMSYSEILDYFTTHTTGSAADLAVAAAFINQVEQDCPDAVFLAKAIVTQELKIGVTATTLNTVYGDTFIPKIGCMLGRRLDTLRLDQLTWPYIVTEKLDGIRRILVKENGACTMYSRAGHQDEGLVDIMSEARHLPDNAVYDGELLAIGAFNDSIEERQATASIANTKGIKKGLTYNIFDMIPLNEFRAGASYDDARRRKTALGAFFMDESIQHIEAEKWPMLIQACGAHQQFSFIKYVPILGLARNMSEVDEIVTGLWAQHKEGVMLNSVGGKYVLNRTRELIKIKHTEEKVLRIIDIIEGTGKFEGCMGSVIVDYKGSSVGVGSGFTDEQRQYVWENQSKIIGMDIEVDTFGESTNAGGGVSLNCAIFKRFLGGE